MKKILLILIIFAFSMPCFAAKMLHLGSKIFLDVDSVKYYVNDGGQMENNKKIFWLKCYNNQSTLYSVTERISKQKIGYVVLEYIIDTQNSKMAHKTSNVFNTNNQAIEILIIPDDRLIWKSIEPGSLSEILYKFAINPQFMQKLYIMQELKQKTQSSN